MFWIMKRVTPKQHLAAGRNKIDAVRTGARDCTRRTHASEEARHALWSEANEPRL